MSSIALQRRARSGVLRAAIADARRRMHERRVRLGLIVLLVAVVVGGATAGIVLGLQPSSSPPTSALKLAPARGSAGMPTTFVAAKSMFSDGEAIAVVNSHTGAVVRTLVTQDVSYFGGLVSNADDVFYVSASAVASRAQLESSRNAYRPNIYEISRSGGTPKVLVRDVEASTLAISPDGTRLAWVSENNPSTTSTRAAISVMDLASRVVRAWSLALPEGPLGTHGASTAYRFDSSVTAMGWENDDDLAVTTGVLGVCVGTTTNCLPSLPRGAELPDPSLVVVSTRAQAPKLAVYTVPVRSGFECPVSSFFKADGFLAGTGTANQLLAYAVRPGGTAPLCETPRPGFHNYPFLVKQGVDLVRLDISGSAVTVTEVGALPLGLVPTTLDHDGKDLLATGAFTTGPNKGATFSARIIASDHLVYLGEGTGEGLSGYSWNDSTW
jgi:hypothetical protein